MTTIASTESTPMMIANNGPFMHDLRALLLRRTLFDTASLSAPDETRLTNHGPGVQQEIGKSP